MHSQPQYLPACMVLLSSEYNKYRKNTQKCSKKTLTFFVLSARLGSAQDRGNSRPGNLIAVRPRRSRIRKEKIRITSSPSSYRGWADVNLLALLNSLTAAPAVTGDGSQEPIPGRCSLEPMKSATHKPMGTLLVTGTQIDVKNSPKFPRNFPNRLGNI